MKVQMSAEDAINRLFSKVKDVEDVTLAQIEIQKTILRVLIDTGAADIDLLIQPLRELSGQDKFGPAGNAALSGLATSFEDLRTLSAENDQTPHLRLVRPANDQD